MLELKEEKLKIKLGEDIFELRYPTIDDTLIMKKVEKKPELMKKFFLKIGMSEEHYTRLTAKHIELIIAELVGTKKN